MGLIKSYAKRYAIGVCKVIARWLIHLRGRACKYFLWLHRNNPKRQWRIWRHQQQSRELVRRSNSSLWFSTNVRSIELLINFCEFYVSLCFWSTLQILTEEIIVIGYFWMSNTTSCYHTNASNLRINGSIEVVERQ